MLIQEYSELLNKYNIERPKCKCCGNDIFYGNTSAKYWRNKIIIKGKSYQTIKKVDGIDYQLKVCQSCLLSNYPSIKNLSRTFNVMSEQTMFAFDIPQEAFDNARSKYAMTKNHMIEKYGEEEGLKKWEEYCKKQAETNTYEYKQSKYGWTEEQFKKYNESRAVTLENLIKRHGEEEGLKKWKSYCDMQSKTKSWEYMVKKYGEEQASIINKMKSNTLENFIRKYGPEQGAKHFEEFSAKKMNGYSKISQDFFKKLDSYLTPKYTTYFAEKNNGGEIFRCGKNQIYYLDYYIEELNMDIEFNGDAWHGNPNIFKSTDHCSPLNKNITAGELQKKDLKRYKELKDTFDINTIVIWESEYNDKNFDIKDFIKNKLHIDINI